ncbi:MULTISPECIES: hypothetical protein [Streptomyces]|uniref:Uncharacterized protein n=1 Tax=Streptomyces stelliscabiei TaxID=146820 RepID=A0A8I0TTN8_9ACTN|nr:hypothetical protein [Streptomyces stelliscabiei]MBE1599887.1 hypothetical protein [Streptomyces stelliscabiei]
MHDLRSLGYQVRAESALEHTPAPGTPQPAARNERTGRRSQIAQAAAVRPSRITALATAAPAAPPQAARTAQPGAAHGRGRRA